MDRELELEVICGTYEEFVVGYQLFTYSGNDKADVRQFEQTFADHSHTASVRAVACRGDLLASGGADEIVKLYNMRRRVETGQLMDHDGTITCLEFHGRHHLLTGSEDGRVAVVRTDNWQCEKFLGRHPGGVTALSIHPSGRLALTAGKDGKLITWDLVRGRVAFRTNLKAAAEFVVWSPDGGSYAVGVQGRCDVYSVASAGILHSLKSAGKINCAVYLSNSRLVCGDETGQASEYDVSAGEGGGRGCSWAAHEARLRAVTAVARSEGCAWLVTASSDGWLKVWEADTSDSAVPAEPVLISSYNTTCRLTSVTTHVPPEKRWPPQEAADLAAEAAERAAAAAERAAAAAERAADRVARASQKADRDAAGPSGVAAERKRPREDGEEKRKGKKKRVMSEDGTPRKVKKADREGKKEKKERGDEKEKGKEKSKDKKTMKKKGVKAVTSKPKNLKKIQKSNIKGLKGLSLKSKKKKSKVKSMNKSE